MKKAILLLALVASVIVAGYSCNWFGTGKNSAKDPFIGKWKIDTVQTNDSASLGTLLMAMAFDDSASHHLEFTTDSVTILTKGKTERTDWNVDEDKKQLSFNKGDVVQYVFLSDSALRLTDADSTALFLLKK